jgi:hypothetical protein
MSMRRDIFRIGRFRRGQRGIVGVFAIIFILLVVIVALTQTLAISASNVTDTGRQADSIEALFLAESAMENLGTRVALAPGTWTCDDTFMGVGETTTLGRGSFTILGTATTDFSGAALSSDLCRVKVQGTITSTKVTRTLETIVGKIPDLISIAALNPDLNLVPYTGDRTSEVVVDGIDDEPDRWDFTYPDAIGSNIPWHAWDKNGGADGSRAGFVRKTVTGLSQQTAGGAFSIDAGDVEFEGPITLRLTFDYKVWAGGGAQNSMYFTPTIESWAGATYTPTSTATGCSTFVFCSAQTYTGSNPRSDCGYKDVAGFESGTGGPYASGCTSHTVPPVADGWKTGFVTFTIATTGLIQLKKLAYELQVKAGQPAWIWVDNFRLSVPSILDGSPNKMWREVSF